MLTAPVPKAAPVGYEGAVTRYRRHRRLFLADLGRTAAGFVVAGPLLAACDGGEGGDATGGADATTAAQPDAADATPPAPVQASGDPTEALGDTPATTGPQVRQVPLGFVSAYVLVRGGEAMVVDTGVAGSDPAIGAVLDELGVGWGGVGHVVLTHSHPDHVGSIGEVAALAADAVLYAGAADISAVSAPRGLTAVGDGEMVFGTRVIATPGHTPGHISLFEPGLGAVFAGDAINNVDGVLTGPNPQFSADMETAIASAGVLAALFPETVYFGHGEVLEDAAGPLNDLVATL